MRRAEEAPSSQLIGQSDVRAGYAVVSVLIELFSPSTQCCETCVLRRSVQSQGDFNLFLLNQSGCPSGVNGTFFSFCVRAK
jgi:hypothetical protein